jgi:hypothetical protein
MLSESEQKRLTEKGENIEARKEVAYPIRNADIEDIRDMKNPKVTREDGLPTIDDLKDLMGKEDKEEESEADIKTKKLSDFIEVIIKIGK